MLRSSSRICCSSDELSGNRQQLLVMAPALLFGILLLAALSGLHGACAEKSQCPSSEFWNSDLEFCVPCASCKQYPKTPSCNTCKFAEEMPDVWKLAAITSFSVLAVVLIGAALIIGIMVHRRRSQKRPLREPIEETAGPLYQA